MGMIGSEAMFVNALADPEPWEPTPDGGTRRFNLLYREARGGLQGWYLYTMSYRLPGKPVTLGIHLARLLPVPRVGPPVREQGSYRIAQAAEFRTHSHHPPNWADETLYTPVEGEYATPAEAGEAAERLVRRSQWAEVYPAFDIARKLEG